AQGSPIWVNITTLGTQEYAAVATDAAGNFVVTWSSQNQDGSGWGVYAREYDAAGAALSGEYLVNTTTAGDQLYSSAARPGGNLVIVWSGNGVGDADGVFAQRFRSASNAPVLFGANNLTAINEDDTS